MVYLYFDQPNKKLYLYDDASHMRDTEHADIHWDGIDSVSADKDRGQICAHVISKGIVAEFPIGRTVLTCQQPVK